MSKTAALELNSKTQLKKAEETSTSAKESPLAPVIANLESKVLGQSHVIELSLATFLAGGHLLLEGPPGVGKTSLARAIAQCFSAKFNRIQMTSDLLPGEVVGILRPSADGKEFEFRRGPIFTNILLADELNRTSPKTQAALLEAMAENTVSVDGVTYPIEAPFFVIATQNPSESHGVYPLAESQLDRFTTQVLMDLPSEKDELQIYQNLQKQDSVSRTSKGKRPPFFNLKELTAMIEAAEKTFVEESLLNYALSLARATREHEEVKHGISVRGVSQFIAVAKSLAYIRGRDFATPEDLKAVAVQALAHRLKLENENWEVGPKRTIVMEILETVKAPR